VELYLRWAPRALVEWSEVSLIESAPPPPRKVRLATVHYAPKGGKTAMDSCRQFARFIEDVDRRNGVSLSRFDRWLGRVRARTSAVMRQGLTRVVLFNARGR